MILYLKKVLELLKKFVRIQVRHVLRAENSQANELAKLATASQEDLDRLIPVENLPEPSINIKSEEIFPVMIAPSWMDPIWDYLLKGTLPSDLKEASKIRARSSRFSLLRGTLYKRGFSAPLLKFIVKEDDDYVLREVHEGVCGNYIRARTLVGKTLRQGYYCPHDAQRRHGTGQKMQNLSGACQDLPPPIRATDLDHKPLTFSAVGFRHIRALTRWEGLVQVHHYRGGLLNHMGRDRAISNNHKEKGTQLYLAFHNMQVRNPKSIGV